MSDELKVQIPSGYRWVNVGETRSSEIWLSADHGRWKPVPIIFGHMEHEFTYITPILPEKPEAVAVALETSDGMLRFHNPNEHDGAMPWLASCAPCIVGPEWAFAGFVWESGSVNLQYVDVVDGKIIYAKAVRFLRVQGGAK